jgi:hypothetical protein
MLGHGAQIEVVDRLQGIETLGFFIANNTEQHARILF